MVIYVNQKFSHLHQDFLTHKGQTEVKSPGQWHTRSSNLTFLYTVHLQFKRLSQMWHTLACAKFSCHNYVTRWLVFSQEAFD